MADISKLEQQDYADEYADKISAWELFAVALICKELNKIGKMTPTQAKELDVEKLATDTEQKIVEALAVAVATDIKSLPKTLTDILTEWHNESKYLYEYKNIPFVEVAENADLQKIVSEFSKKSGSELLEIVKTKAIRVIDANENPVALREQILKSFDEASGLIVNNTIDFHAGMRKSVLELGGSGMRVDYGTAIVDGKPRRITRRLDTVVRQNLLYNVKMASVEYNRQIGDELDCDGIEISFSVNPRPTHRFMEGRQFCDSKSKEINGKHFDGAEDTRDTESGKNVLESLQDYNCNHRATPIICGVSEPAYSDDELAKLKAENEKQFTIDGHTGDGYYWSQRMRAIETETRKAKDQINALKAFGNSETQISDLNKKIKAYRQKYNEICDITGIKPDLKRMSIPRRNK